MLTQTPQRSYTPEEYLELEEKAEYKSQYYVEQFAKTSEGKWLLTEYELEDAVLGLSSLEFQIQLSDIYKGIEFESNEE